MKNIGIAINPSKDKDSTILNMVVQKFRDKFNLEDIHIFNCFDIGKQEINHIDLLVVLGGDGTLLGIARNLNEDFNGIILGINIGNLGFLSSIEISDIDEALINLEKRKYKVVDRMLLSGNVECDSKVETFKALNDVVLARGTL